MKFDIYLESCTHTHNQDIKQFYHSPQFLPAGSLESTISPTLPPIPTTTYMFSNPIFLGIRIFTVSSIQGLASPNIFRNYSNHFLIIK